MVAKKTSSASEEFWDAIISGSTVLVDCGFCGRTHYSTEEPQSYDEGEFEELQEKHNRDPNRFIEHAEFVHYGTLDGKNIVYGCPCESASFYENLIWKNKGVISKYLSARADKMTKQAQAEQKRADLVKRSIDTLSSE